MLETFIGSAWLLTYALKSIVDRPRPALWSTPWSTWYQGSSFPSGHTLSTAAFATAVTLGASVIWPGTRYLLVALAVVWMGLMGLSRMVLGVHWPADVLAAMCLEVFVPLAISVALDLHQYRRSIS